MREKDNGEKLLDELVDMMDGSAAGIMYTDAAAMAYQLAGDVVHELDTVKEENVALKKRIADLEQKTAITMGVGSGDGCLFVHGDYESVKTVQNKIL